MKLSIKVDSALNTQMLELRTFPCFYQVHRSKFESNWSRVSRVIIRHTNRQTSINKNGYTKDTQKEQRSA